MWKALLMDGRRYGVGRTLVGRFAWQLERWAGIQIYRIGRRPLDSIDRERRECPPELHVKLLTPEELLEASSDPSLELPRQVAEASIARRDVVVGGFSDSNLIAYVFASMESAPHDDYFSVRVRKPFRYSFKNFTRPEYRGRGVSQFVTNFPERNKVCMERGCTDSIYFIALSNLPSLKATSKLPETSWIGWTVNGQTFGRRWSIRSPGPRRAGFEFVRQDNP